MKRFSPSQGATLDLARVQLWTAANDARPTSRMRLIDTPATDGPLYSKTRNSKGTP